jgi:SAM-dependent methyltransferase
MRRSSHLPRRSEAASPTWRALSCAVLLVALQSLVVLIPVAARATTFDEEVGLMVDWLKLAPGSVLADIGAGEGAFAIALSRYVAPGGKVFATEIEQKDREALVAKAAEVHAPNIEVRAATHEGTGLPASCCDAILLREVYHHVTAAMPLGKSLFETLRPGGRLVVIDFPPSRRLGVGKSEGIEADKLIAELTAAGFVMEERLDAWPTQNFENNHYGLAFTRP